MRDREAAAARVITKHVRQTSWRSSKLLICLQEPHYRAASPSETRASIGRGRPRASCHLICIQSEASEARNDHRGWVATEEQIYTDRECF